MLTAEGLGYRLPDGRQLFEGIDLRLGPGDVVAIEGPSGMGKSTLLALIGGLLTPTNGSVDVQTDRRAPFAWVLQTLNSLSARTVMANSCLYNVIDGQPARSVANAAASLLDEVGIGHLRRKRARQLSGGELQRLAVVRALVSSRPIVLADEPSNQLDRVNAGKVMRALTSASSDDRLVVIVTHDRESLPPECRVLRLSAEGLSDG